MRLLAILDTETAALDGPCIEAAVSLYDLKHAAVVRSFSSLIRHTENQAEAINGIPPALLLEAPPPEPVWHRVREVIDKADAIVAHNASFDRRFVPEAVQCGKPWICSCWDLLWPRRRQDAGEGLIQLALAHGLGVATAHRASADVELLARLLTRVAEMGVELEPFLARGLRPKALFVVADERFDAARNELAKQHSFKWDQREAPKRWSRTMAVEDAAALPFAVDLV